jgi:arylsulfatase
MSVERTRERLPIPTSSGEPAVRPPSAGAPNVVLVLLDDVGFGAPSAFGGPVEMPTAERLAANGLRHTRFHVTALCSPTRQALLTGRNHHSVNMGTITDFATGNEGYTSVRPQSAATIARILSCNGYRTAAFGKMHQTPQWELSAAGPFDRWPTGDGFEKFYGFLGGCSNHWSPRLYDGITPIDIPEKPEATYHLTEDLVDQAISWVNLEHTLRPFDPFFVYLSFGAGHSPHHPPRDLREKYKGKFDHGWDRQRELTFRRQKELGVIPETAELPPMPPEVQPWSKISPLERRVAAALMENYAGFVEHADTQFGRIVDTLAELDILDNTLIVYILGDNGASVEAGPSGSFNEIRLQNGVQDSADELADRLDEIGGPTTWPCYPAGWALAMNTPYQFAKFVASHYGGTRNGMITHWPAGIEERGGLREQWHHVIDIAPTILAAAGIPEPTSVDGFDQQPIEGTSMIYCFSDKSAPGRRTIQYFEMHGNRGIYSDEWMAVTKHSSPFEWADLDVVRGNFVDDKWELYDLTTDWTEAKDVAAEHPQKLRELQDVFLAEATRHNVLPLDDRITERCNPAIAGRADPLRERTSMTFKAGMNRLTEDTVPSVKNRSHAITAEVEITNERPNGVIVSQGGQFAGWTLYLVDGCPAYTYNYLGIEWFTVGSEQPLPTGVHNLRLEFAYDGGGLGKGGTAKLFIDGESVASGYVGATVSVWFESTLDIGLDVDGPTCSAYEGRFPFSDEIRWVRIDIAPDVTEVTWADRAECSLRVQ